MQKKIIALAVAGLVSGAAFAQTNVTIYGGVDLSFANVNPDNAASTNVVFNNGVYTSRLGLRGEENLGNGLTAYFNLENGLTADAPADAFGGTARQSLVGLKGSFGAVQMGSMSSLSHAWSAIYDYAGNFSGSVHGQLRKNGTTSGNVSPGNGNSIAYLSPSMSGLTAGVARTFSETNNNDTDLTQLGVNYGNGPIAATYVYETTANTGGRANFLGGSYNFGVVKLVGEYTDFKSDAVSRGKFWQLGVVAPVGAGNVHVGYGKGKSGADDNSDKSFTLAYTHGLSKRTTAYAGYMRNSGDGSVATTFADSKIIAAGLIHNF